MAMIGPVCLALWQSQPTRERFAIQRDVLHGAVARDPGKVAFMCVVTAGAPPPGDAERAASAAMVSSQGDKLAGVACVIEGVGFRAAITRTVLSGVLLMIRTPSPIKLFDGTYAAEPWLAKVVGRKSLAGLTEQCERGRELLNEASVAV